VTSVSKERERRVSISLTSMGRMVKVSLLDIFMCLIILSYSIWLLLILVNGKTRSIKMSPWKISANSSCLRINATHFSSENVICVNRLISANHSLDCYDNEQLIAYHLLPKNRESSKVKKDVTCRRRRCLHIIFLDQNG
jgi:dipeptidase